MPAIPTERASFTWSPSEKLLDLDAARELPDPFDEAWIEYKEQWAQSGREIDDSIRDWRVLVGSPTEVPHVVFSTRRIIDGLHWDGDGLTASLTTSRLVPAPILDRDLRFTWRGAATIDLASGTVQERFDALPAGPDGAFNGISGHPNMVVHKDGQVTLSLPGPAGPFRSNMPYVQGANGVSLSLDLPLGASGGPTLLADGKTVIFTGDHATVPLTSGSALLLWDTYFLPVGGIEAIKIKATNNLIRKRDQNGQLDPYETRIAFLTVIGGESYLAAYDSGNAELRTVAKVPATGSTSIIWYRSDSVVEFKELNVPPIQVDLDTGIVSPSIPERFVAPEGLSPDGRWELELVQPDSGQQPPAAPNCTDQPYRVLLHDRQIRTTRTLFECDGGFISNAHWVSNEKFVLLVSEGRAGKGGPGSYLPFLVDVQSGARRQLLPERITGGQVIASPKSDQFLILADHLMLFAIDGSLLRDYGPAPDGYQQVKATWSPDGSQFAYYLKPSALGFF